MIDDAGSTVPAGGDFAFSQTGTFVYLPGPGLQTGWSISWLDSSGHIQPLHGPPGIYFGPRFSPDGKQLAFGLGRQAADIWVKDLDRDTSSRLSVLPGVNAWPVWAPDGKSIVFQADNAAAPGLYWMRSDGSGEAQRLTDGTLRELPHSFAPDGKRMALQQQGTGGSPDIYTAVLEGDPDHPRLGERELFLGTPFAETSPAFSPDGRWLAYTSNESGTSEVYVRPFPGPGGRRQISSGGGISPRWARDGRELIFRSPDYRIMAASYAVESDGFVAGKPRAWSAAHVRDLGLFNAYDLAPDGKRLAAILADAGGVDQKPLTQLTVLLGFFDELRRRLN